MKAPRALGVAALAVIVSGCATTSDLPSMEALLSEATGQSGRACVDKSDIRGYGVLEDDIISIDGGSDYYLATVLPGCIDLVSSIGVAFKGGFGEICGQTSDTVITNDNYCTINHMYEFNSRDEAFAAYDTASERRKELKQLAEDE